MPTQSLQDRAAGALMGAFIGDALADFKAARTCGLAFLGIVPQGGPNIFPADVAISPDPGHQHWPRLLGQSFALP